jgi:alkane 1-monooxygenase
MQLFKKLSFLWAYSLAAVIILSYYWGGKNWTFFGVFYAYFLIPMVDELIGKDANNVKKEAFEDLLKDWYFDFLVYSHVYIQYFLLGWVSYVLVFDNLSIIQIIGLVLSHGVYAAGIINVAHELGHRQHPLAQFHARIALLSVSYMHFVIEHNRGHHVHVATPLDPATSKKNQTVFAFWQQTLIGSFKSAWNIEVKLLEKKGKKTWVFSNEMIWFCILPIVFCAAITLIFSQLANNFAWIVIVFFVAQSIIAILTLETVNYIEHYGIVRREIAPNKYERVNPLHSWNANHFYSNLMLFQLQRHSDHHAFASRPYQILRHFDESPQLPFGYPVMILMALFPSLWFKIMNKRLENWQKNAFDSEHISKVVKQFV